MNSTRLEEYISKMIKSQKLNVPKKSSLFDCLSVLTKPEKDFPGKNNVFFLQDEFIRKYATVGGIEKDEIEMMLDGKKKLLQDEAVAEILWHCYRKIYHSCKEVGFIDQLPEIEWHLPDTYGVFFLLLALAGYPDAIKFYRVNGLPETIMNDTLSDLSVWTKYYRRESRIVGISRRILGWMQYHIRGDLFRLGRIQFQRKYKLEHNIHVFRHQENGNVKVLSGGGIRYNRQGLFDGIGGGKDSDGYWISVYRKTANIAKGNPISVDGYARKNEECLNLKEWHEVFKQGDIALNIHIPAIGPLDMDACAESIADAGDFFKRYFPDEKFNAIICNSWFLDPQLKNIIGSKSNILSFQRSGRLFPIGGESEAVLRVFGIEAVKKGINFIPHVSKLQQSLADFIENGGALHNGGWFLLTDLLWPEVKPEQVDYNS